MGLKQDMVEAIADGALGDHWPSVDAAPADPSAVPTEAERSEA